MNKIKIILFPLLLCYINLPAQFGTFKHNSKDVAIDLYAYNVEKSITNADSFEISIDSIHVKFKTSQDKIEATSTFEKSNSILYINCYLRNDSLLKVTIKEPSPLFTDMFSASIFYIEDNKIFDEQYRCTVRPCMGIPLNKSIDELYGYNKYLRSDFLKSYIAELLKKIKPFRHPNQH